MIVIVHWSRYLSIKFVWASWTRTCLFQRGSSPGIGSLIFCCCTCKKLSVPSAQKLSWKFLSFFKFLHFFFLMVEVMFPLDFFFSKLLMVLGVQMLFYKAAKFLWTSVLLLERNFFAQVGAPTFFSDRKCCLCLLGRSYPSRSELSILKMWSNVVFHVAPH